MGSEIKHPSPKSALDAAIRRAELLDALRWRGPPTSKINFSAPSILMIEDLLDEVRVGDRELLRWYTRFVEEYAYLRGNNWLMIIHHYLTFGLLMLPVFFIGSYYQWVNAIGWFAPLLISGMHMNYRKAWQEEMLKLMRESFLEKYWKPRT